MALPSMQSYGVTVVCLWLLSTGAFAEILPSILWNSENPLFKHLGDTARKVMPFDKLSITCPNLVEYPIKRDNFYSKDFLYENVFMVDKKGYDSCNATSGLKILSCDNPVELGKHARIVFQPRSANANDPEFKQGKEYYLINTASGLMDSLKSFEGGRCKDGQMKMKLYVCKKNNDSKCQHGNKVVHGGWSDWSKCTEGNLQSRQCNNPYPENGGLPCYGELKRPCSTKASQTLGRKGSSCSTVTHGKTTASPPGSTVTHGKTTASPPGIPSKDTRTGDKFTENQLNISKGLFAVICLIVLVVGLAVGGVLTMLVCWMQRWKQKTNIKITRVPSALSTRPVSTFSTASESANMVRP